MEKADLINKDNLQGSFLYYKLAYKVYLSSFKLENSKNIAGIQILKFLLNLKQYNQIIKFWGIAFITFSKMIYHTQVISHKKSKFKTNKHKK